MSISTGQADIQLDRDFGSATPATWYAAFLIGLPTADAGTGYVEPADVNYARVALTNNATNFPAATGGVQKVAAAIEWPQATVQWNGLGIALFDASTGGNAAYWDSKAQTVPIGGTARFNANELEIER